MKRVMYIECKSEGLDGPGRIGWVEFSRSMRSFYYGGRRFQKTKSGYKYNCLDAQTGEAYWISGPKKDGTDKLYGGVVEIDEDAREVYWSTIRHRPQSTHLTRYRS
jgi:hypothetical protein